jgi:hypothetical protein
MIGNEPNREGSPTRSLPRSHVTPPGYKNVRVFVPKSLHYRLICNSAASEMSLQDFVVSWLERATPLVPTSAPDRPTTKGPSPSPQSGLGLAVDPRPLQTAENPTTTGLEQVPAPLASDALSPYRDVSPDPCLAIDPSSDERGPHA